MGSYVFQGDPYNESWINDEYYGYSGGRHWFYHGDGGLYCSYLEVSTQRDNDYVRVYATFNTTQVGRDNYSKYMTIYAYNAYGSWQAISSSNLIGGSGPGSYSCSTDGYVSVYWPRDDAITIHFDADCSDHNTCVWGSSSSRSIGVTCSVPEYYKAPSIWLNPNVKRNWHYSILLILLRIRH